MKTKEIIELDYRKEENKEIIQKVLKKIKPLSKFDKTIPLKSLEKCLAKLNIKYNYYQRIFFDSQEDYILYHCYIERANKTDIKIDIYGISIYEVLAKTIIYIYSKTKGGSKC